MLVLHWLSWNTETPKTFVKQLAFLFNLKCIQIYNYFQFDGGHPEFPVSTDLVKTKFVTVSIFQFVLLQTKSFHNVILLYVTGIDDVGRFRFCVLYVAFQVKNDAHNIWNLCGSQNRHGRSSARRNSGLYPLQCTAISDVNAMCFSRWPAKNTTVIARPSKARARLSTGSMNVALNLKFRLRTRTPMLRSVAKMHIHHALSASSTLHLPSTRPIHLKWKRRTTAL
jgi:hypothetical protein